MSSQKTIVREKSETDERYGKKPSERSVSEHIHKGFVILDKPSGPTSHQVADWVKKIFGLKKAGHSGTLDPKVTGVLPTALGESTKVLQAVFGADKEYVCLMKLHCEVTSSLLKKVLSDYQGEITQMPPVKSAVKRRYRKRRVHRIQLLERQDDYVLFKVLCEAGTYIRKLCHDMGETLEVGAHMRELRRTRAGGFTEEETVILQDLKDAYMDFKETGNEKWVRECVLPMEEIVRDLPKIWVKDSAIDTLCHGAALNLPGVSQYTDDLKKAGMTALMSLKGELVALGMASMDADGMKADTGEAAKLKRVVMPQGTYPPHEKARGQVE